MATKDKALLSKYLTKILNSKVYDVVIETPIEEAASLSKRLGVKFLLKREDLQSVHSFKIRGAYNKMSQLPADVLAKGVLAASAGNHAQGVALSAKRLGCKATIVMPVTTPDIKVNAVKGHGAQAVLAGDSYSDAAEEAAQAHIHPSVRRRGCHRGAGDGRDGDSPPAFRKARCRVRADRRRRPCRRRGGVHQGRAT